MITDLKGPVKKNVTPSRATFDSVTKVFSKLIFIFYLSVYLSSTFKDSVSLLFFFFCVSTKPTKEVPAHASVHRTARRKVFNTKSMRLLTSLSPAGARVALR